MGLGLAALLLTGCGDEQPADDAEAIAATINEVRDGIVAGDGQAVCERLTERGNEVMLRIAMHPRSEVEADTCAEAVEGLASEFRDSERAELAEGSDYAASDVDLGPGGGVTDRTEGGSPTGEVEIPCKGDDANSYFAVREEERWKLMLPFCSGR